VYDYLELADVLPTWSSQPDKDLAQLCRRIAFGALVRNTDDHMRNHAFIRTGDGWRLSPAFDVNPDVLPWTEFVTSVDAHAGAGRL
ncbi:HipA domain-containing protein, partial [Pseudomonas sp. AH2 (2023)]|uniref:HipA domain-containing protein n=1 Tax=Pseudomonas sp. AH2 (2023) TaxID=3048599 RepID=UPI002B239FB2